MEPELNILLIEDNPDDARWLEILLTQDQPARARVTHTERLSAGLGHLKTNPVDAVLLDLSLPDSRGLETVRRAREHSPKTPLVVLTGLNDEAMALEAVKLGAQDYLVKDQANGEALSRALRYAIERQRAEQRVRQAEARYRQIFENALEGIYQCTPHGRLLIVNAALARLAGYASPDQMIARITRMQDQFYVDPASWAAAMQQLADNGILQNHESECWHADGTRLWITENMRAVKDAGGHLTHFECFAQEITDRKRAESAIRQRTEQLDALHAIDRAISNSLDLRIMLEVLLQKTCATLTVDAAAILLFNSSTQALEYVAGRGFNYSSIQKTRLGLGEDCAGRAALERQVIGMSALGPPPTVCPRVQVGLAEECFRAHYAAPLIAKGHIKGVLEIFHRSVLNPSKDWLDFLRVLAGQAAIGVDNAQLFEAMQRSNTELSLAYDLTLEGWSRALDLRDKDTEGHSQRVAEMTVRLGRVLKRSDLELVHLRRGALLHDIGKLGVPDTILWKPSALTDTEMNVMKQHPQLAYNLLWPIVYLRPALDIPYAHHEKWDGTGYPRGLKGETIPWAARIFAVVDVWDALTSDRPYRKAWSQEKALDYLQAQVGTHFDPQAVEAFLSIVYLEGALKP